MSKSTSILSDNFISRLEQMPVQTSRYLWHIKYNHYNSDLRIAAHGLIRPDNYAVFAHNNIFNFDLMYPYFMDIWEFETQTLERCSQFSTYSFWRIDTRLANVDWYIDPNMFEDSKSGGFNYKNYVCALHNIPNYALKLFKYDRDRFVSKRPFITRNEGVASIRPYRNDFDSLIPDVNINNYIKWRSQNIPLCT